MSSLLAYGHGLLSEDIGSGLGLTEPWAQSLGWMDGDSSAGPANVQHREDTSVVSKALQPQAWEAGGGGGLSQFFNVIQAGAPSPEPQKVGDLADVGLDRSISSMKDALHWDSPPQSPNSSFIQLPHAVLTIVTVGTKADVVVVGVFQHKIGSNSILETIFSLPKGLNLAEYVVFKPDILECVTGKVLSTETLNLPVEFTRALGARPQAFLGNRFHMQGYDGVILGLWRDGSSVSSTAEAVFADCVKCLPLVLSNRFNAKTYERLSRRFDAILKVIPDAVLFVDDEVAQVVLNPAAATLLGLPNHGEVDPNKVALAMRALTERCSSRTDPQHWTKLLSKDKEMEIEEDWELKLPRRVLHVRSYPVISRAAHGRLWVYEDVTTQRDAELAMETANRAKSQFLAMMSHELRTPMTGVLGMLDLLHLTNLEEEQQILVKIMQESAEGLMDVINNILDYCKIEAGRLQLEEIDFSLTEMLEQIQAMLKTSFLKKELKVTFSQEFCRTNVVRGDPVRLRQILLNLISNAIKFTEDGSVSVTCRFLDPQWEDTTVVATSQTSSGKSKLINQIISASRGEKCTVEHSTTMAGRSVIVVNFSSAGAAGPYLESSSISNFRSPSMPFPSDLNHPGVHLPSGVSPMATTNLPTQSRGLLSFPVSYSFQPENRHPISPSAPSQFAETRYSFTDRKSIGGQESSRNHGLSASLSSTSRENPSTVTWEGTTVTTTTPLTPTPLLDDQNSQSDEAEPLKATKYRRLSSEGASGSLLRQFQESSSSAQSTSSPEQWWEHVYPGIDTYPKWLAALNPPAALNYRQSSSPSFASQDSSSGYFTEPGKQIFCGQQQRASLVGRNEPGIVTKNRPSPSTQFLGNEKLFTAGPEAGSTMDGLHRAVGDLRSQTKERPGENMKRINPDDRVWLEVVIKDTGVGIGHDQLKRLFVGSQAGSERRNAAGTGLGLAIVKGLLCLMNGKIQIDSKIGDGTTVLLTIPLLPAAYEHLEDNLDNGSLVEPSTTAREILQSVPDAESFLRDLGPTENPEDRFSPTTTSSCPKHLDKSERILPPVPFERKIAVLTDSSPTKSVGALPDSQEVDNSVISSKKSGAESPKSKRLRVLVAEDNKVNQLLIGKMFQHLKQEVEMVGNGKLAIEAVQRSKFDLILMDVQMPILDGLSATKAIRGLPPPVSQIPIYALSADAPGSGPLSETGLDGYLKKPIVWSTMSDLIGRIVASRGEQS